VPDLRREGQSITKDRHVRLKAPRQQQIALLIQASCKAHQAVVLVTISLVQEPEVTGLTQRHTHTPFLPAIIFPGGFSRVLRPHSTVSNRAVPHHSQMHPAARREARAIYTTHCPNTTQTRIHHLSLPMPLGEATISPSQPTVRHEGFAYSPQIEHQSWEKQPKPPHPSGILSSLQLSLPNQVLCPHMQSWSSFVLVLCFKSHCLHLHGLKSS